MNLRGGKNDCQLDCFTHERAHTHKDGCMSMEIIGLCFSSPLHGVIGVAYFSRK